MSPNAGPSLQSSSSDTEFDIRWLLAPIDPDEFWTSHWEREPLVIHRSAPSYYGGLLAIADVDQILSTSAIREGDIRVIRRGTHTPVSQLGQVAMPGSSTRLEGLYREYRGGATIIIQGLHERWGPLGRLSRNVAQAVCGGAQANAYLTPPGETGLLPHYDTHDVMVLQASGSKHWRIFDQAVDAPTRDQPYRRALEPGDVTREFVMTAGDFMYLPRGVMHVAETREEASLHLTVGIHPITVAAVLRTVVERAIRDQPRLRKALAPGFASDDASRERAERQVHEALASITQNAGSVGAVDEAAKWALLSESPSLDGHLLDLLAADDLNLGTELQLRRDLKWRLNGSDQQVAITFNGKHVLMPGFVEPCLLHISSGDVFSVGDLPDVIDDESKVLLASRLLHEGFLTSARA